MRVLVLAGLITAATAPLAAAAETDFECQVDDTRHSAQERADAAPALPATPARPVMTQSQNEEGPARPAVAERRRNGKPIPDAHLIGTSRVL